MSYLRHSLHSRTHHRRHLQANENGIRTPRFSDLQKSTPTHDDDGGGGGGGCGDDDNTTTTAAAASAAVAAATSTERIFP